jgi:hypothetical protein
MAMGADCGCRRQEPLHAAGSSGTQSVASIIKWDLGQSTPSAWRRPAPRQGHAASYCSMGKDPLSKRRGANAAHALKEAKRITFDQCAAAYLDAHRGAWQNPKHVTQWESTIANCRFKGTKCLLNEERHT